jgi:ABC-2 type transport system ATP-binding protein
LSCPDLSGSRYLNNLSMIQIQKLHKSYDDVIALNGIDLNIRDGAITGLLGPNGAGKTTLVLILTGIIKKNSGKVFINGMDLDKNLSEIQSIISIVPQTLAFYPLLTAYENLEYFGALYGLQGKRLKESIEFSIEVASLQSFVKKRAGKFSGGMQRRLNLAIGMLNDPRILILDEPTVGVDAQSRKYILEMIRKINLEKKSTVIYTSHYISEIQQISDDVVIIDNGKIILNGTMDSILSTSEALAIQVEAPDHSALDRIQDVTGVTHDGDSIYIDRNEMLYENIIRIVTLLRDNNIRINNIQYNANKLEELYLRLTSERLRDEE